MFINEKTPKLNFSYIQISGKYVFKWSSYVCTSTYLLLIVSDNNLHLPGNKLNISIVTDVLDTYQVMCYAHF